MRDLKKLVEASSYIDFLINFDRPQGGACIQSFQNPKPALNRKYCGFHTEAQEEDEVQNLSEEGVVPADQHLQF